MEGNYNLYSNKNNLSLFYKNKQMNLNIPENSFNLSLLHKLFSPEYLSKAITGENAYYLMKFLPKDDSNIICNPQQLSNLLLNTTTKFNTPINDFYEKYLHRFFTYNYQSKLELFNLENTSDFITKKNIMYIQLKNMLNNIEQNKNNNINNNNTNETNNINNNINNINPNVIRNTHYNSNENIITFDMHSELASSGYTSIDFDKDSKHSNSRKNSGNFNGSGNSRERNNITNNNLKENQNQKLGMSINNLSKINQKNKIMSSTNNSFMEHSDDNDSFIDRNILKSERFKYVKKNNKIQITIKPRTKEEIQSFREQEKLRYQKPLQPWEYTLSNGNIAIVAPLFSSTKPLISKARGHELLKTERPPYITLLSLVRDAAARLEDGVGTRLDICDLLKDSQYINENIADNKINSIVSGALDRLHYQKDPCVKYDSHHKLWIYLHRNRSLDYPGWKKIENIEDDNNEKTIENNNNNIILEDIDDNENDGDNEEIDKSKDKKGKKKKKKEIIEIDENDEEKNKEEEENYKEGNICKIKIDSSSEPNLIDMNEKMYKKLVGKKRSKK